MFKFLRRWFPTKLTPAELELVDYLSSEATLFGSQVWGGVTPKSDYDYYMSDDVHIAVRNYMDTARISWTKHETYNHKFAFDRGTNIILSDGRKLQLMSYEHSKLHHGFLQAIDLMTLVSKYYDVSEKVRRYLYFEDCVTVLKGRPVFNQTVKDIAKIQYPELFI